MCPLCCYTRDGSAVEIVGLCKSTVRWLAKQYSRGVYPYSGVSLAAMAQPSGKTSSKKKNLSYADWNKLLQQSFEAKFWIPESLEEGQQREGDEGPYIHRTGIYKDSYGALQRYADFQLRPNFSIAMVVVSYIAGITETHTSGEGKPLYSGDPTLHSPSF